jgi:hypothetical protein
MPLRCFSDGTVCVFPPTNGSWYNNNNSAYSGLDMFRRRVTKTIYDIAEYGEPRAGHGETATCAITFMAQKGTLAIQLGEGWDNITASWILCSGRDLP